MKLQFLSVLSVFSFSINAQAPIANYDSADGAEYAVVSSTLALDQSLSGANVAWFFNDLTPTGSTNTDTYGAPSAGDSTNFPGTTSVLTTTTSPSSDVGKIFYEQVANTVSFTGLDGQDLIINYINDNALIGTFPLSFNYSNNDTAAGSFVYNTRGALGIVAGTFTGTIDTEVDGYGTLVLNSVNGSGTYNGNVTRLKIVQDLDLSVANGNVVQTTYHYYDDSTGGLVFRTRTVELTSTLLNSSTAILERFVSNVLSVDNKSLAATDLKLTKNPISDYLSFKVSDHATIRSISISDISGRSIISKKFTASNKLWINNLNTGVYILSISTDKGTLSRKFIKL
jgi:hypothetical protein